MTKHESPPFKMVIENGRLVPATAYDQERLDTYRRGSKVNVVMVRDGGRVMERKWFAVLGLVVKQCNVPWKNKDQASEAVKLALGIVNLTKTVGGEFMAYPKSLTELSDPELDEAVRDMMDLIQRMTGIDPATLKKEIADVGEDEQETPSETPPSEGEGSDGAPVSPEPQAVAAAPSPAAAAKTSPASGGPAPADETEAREELVASSAGELIDPVKRMLMEEAIDNMLRDAFSEPAIERPAKVDKLRNVFLEPQNLGEFPDFVNRCHETARRVIGKPGERERAKAYLLGKVPA